MKRTPRTGKPKREDLKQLEAEVLRIRKEKKLGSRLIARELGISNKGWVDRIIYPGVAEKQRKSMMERYFRLKAKNICHQCGQKFPKSPNSH